MHRRRVLEAGSVLAVSLAAGCSTSRSDELRTLGNDDDPFDVDPEELLMSKAQVQERLEGEWVEEESEDHMFLGPDVERQHVPYDREKEEFHMDSGIVTSGVWYYGDVEAARDEFRDHPYQEGWGFEEWPIAVECIGGTTSKPSDVRVVFRDANAIGGLLYDKGPTDEDTKERIGLDLATLMHERWRAD